MIDTPSVKQSTDLRELAAQRTELRRASGEKEQCGPCPKCGGDDRFHCTADWFFCRQCHPKRGDAIEYVQWLGQAHGFKEAVAFLGGQLPAAPATKKQVQHRKASTQQAPDWTAKATALVEKAHKQLMNASLAHPGVMYLDKRGLDPLVWHTFKLGYKADVPLPGTWDSDSRTRCHPPQPAIVIPWYRGGKLAAVRYRFLQAHTYTGTDGKQRTEKQTAEHGSEFAGLLFGGLGLLGAGEKWRTLVLCEGEINCLSIWQAAHETKVDVLSIGSEAQQLTPAAIEYAQQFRHVLIWTDRTEIAQQLQAALPRAYAITSEMCKGQDANDLLRAGHLGGYLSAWRFRAAQDDDEREALLWNLWDAAQLPGSIDAGSKQVMTEIAAKLGIQV